MLSSSDLFRLFGQHYRSIIATTLIVVACSTAGVIAWPNRYSSDGMMFVRLGRGSLSVDPAAQASSSVSMQDGREAEVASVVEMLGSREIAQRVVNRIGVDEINQPRTWISKYAKVISESLSSMQDSSLMLPSTTPLSTSPLSTSPDSLTEEEYNQQIAMEDAIKMVQNALNVEVTKKGHTVAVSAETPDPNLAQSIVQTAMDEYGSYHVEAHRALGSLEFFMNQVEVSRHTAIQTREELQAAKSKLGWIDAESASAALRERMTKLKISLDEAESEVSESESLAISLGASLESVEEWIPTEVTKGIANNAGDSMRNTLYGMQLRGSEELAKLSPNHPRYQMMKSSMDQSESIANSENDARELLREAVNPVRQQLHSDYETSIAKAAGAKSRRASLQKSLEQAQADLIQLNADSITLAKLTWESDIAEKNYLEHAKSLEEVRLSDALDRSNLSDVSVIQNASLRFKKVGPPRLLLIGASSIMGICLGLLQALLRHRIVVPTDVISMQSTTPLSQASASRIVDAGRYTSDRAGPKSSVRYEVGHIRRRAERTDDIQIEEESELAVASQND